MNNGRTVVGRSWLALAGCLVASGALHGQEKRPLSQVLEPVRQRIARDCAMYRAKADTATSDFEKDQARMGQSLNCECLPGELDLVAADGDASREVSPDEALALIKPRLESCGVRVMRKALVAACPKRGKEETGIKDQEAFCKCLVVELDKLPDSKIVADAIEMHKDFQARVQALKDQQPAPPKHAGIMSAIEGTCRVAQGAPRNP